MIKNLVIVRGAGDIATGTIHRLVQCGFSVVALETEQPTVIRRTVAFASAIFDNTIKIEDVEAIKVGSLKDAIDVSNMGKVAVLVDENADSIRVLDPEIVVDGILAKRNIGTHINMAPIVLGLGPGFTANINVHAVIETNRGHNLGRVIFNGATQPNTGVPGAVQGHSYKRVIYAPNQGKIRTVNEIGDNVSKDQKIAYINETPVIAPLSGTLRGLIHEGITVERGMKIGDVDPRGKIEYCFSISDKARAVAGGVLEAVFYLRKQAE